MSKREDSNKKSEYCLKKVFFGLFMVTSGVAVWGNIVLTKLVESLSSGGYATIVQATLNSILIVWILGGFWLTLYGWFNPCPDQIEY